jgi:hypothetical protein
MVKKRDHPKIEELIERPWCYYCERDFDDARVLLSHQKAKHFRCNHCNRRLNTAGGLSVHLQQVHKETLTKVENAIEGREGVDPEIFGMCGVPEDLVNDHKQRIMNEYFKMEAERRARTGNPPPGTATGEPKAKKAKHETPEEIKARAELYKAQRRAQKANPTQANATATATASPTPVPGPISPATTPVSSLALYTRRLVAVLTSIYSGLRRQLGRCPHQHGGTVTYSGLGEHALSPQQHGGTATAVPAAVPTALEPVAIQLWLPAVCPWIPAAVPAATPWLAAVHACADLLDVLSVAGSSVRRSADVPPRYAPRSAPGSASDAQSDVGIHGHQTASPLLSVPGSSHSEHVAAGPRPPCASFVRGAKLQPRRHEPYARWPPYHYGTQRAEEASQEVAPRRDGGLP